MKKEMRDSEMENEKLALHGGTPIRMNKFAKWPEFDDEEINAVLDVVRSGIWSRAQYTNHLKYQYETESYIGKFEKKFTDFLGVDYGVFVNSGTSALHLAFEALELEEGSEVITTPYTFFSTAIPLYRNKLTPVFVDVDENGNIDADLIEAEITDKTKALLIMHCGGYPCNMDKIQNICKKYKLHLIQDCAHALYSEYNHRHVSTYGGISIFSFEASKNLNSGEGGFVATDDQLLFEKMYSIQSCGRPVGGEWRTHINMCENFRPTEFQGALALTQLAKCPDQQKRRDNNMSYLNEALKNHPLVSPIALKGDATSHGAYGYLLKINEAYRRKITGKRLSIYCETEGIPCNSGYLKLIPEIDYAKRFTTEEERARIIEKCPNAQKFIKYTIWLPQTILISSIDDVKDVVKALDKIAANINIG